MRIFEALREDHDKQRALLATLMDTSGASSTRKDYYAQLKDELNRHAIAEERHFYIALMESDKAIEKSRHGIAEHHEIDELIEKLDQTDMSSSAWMSYMKNLNEKVLHHLEEEERETFQLAGRILSDAQKSELATRYQSEMKT
ncbi:hemerythrin domain-containing protein [Aestuariibacter sp. AA17]|uniref:Hemerythrin domain-containing protein n=1 Tax=Fluctibacter corallii TaxID=2984329 RepID=A0ABT3A5D4_9ALTE|nr:hemerythrin domain-containing protein [Aestuariibacter sp. AA17]MCV2883802.1 hemerythrin domain-containing protein [Aestuariibacter sp. AA17]